jgi:hypothetical protein
MRRIVIAASALLCLPVSTCFGLGVSPYLPLSLDPDIEGRIEYVLLLADRPVLRRPIAAATVLDALPAACQKDPVVCEEVRRYIGRYMGNWALVDATLEAAASGDEIQPMPNRFGQTTDSNWTASARGFWQPFDHALLSLGAVAYQDEVVPEGSYASLGWNRAQLDIGYRAHWLSPATGSSMLISTNAATMPSITLSNYTPLTRFGLGYEIFSALMSTSDRIRYRGESTRGRPRLTGIHFSAEPAAGWAIGVTRLMQYGGGARPGSPSDLLRAFFKPSEYDNTNPDLDFDEQFGNQLASFTSELIYPGRVPFSIYFEYSGEDTSNGKNYLLGNSALTAGLHFPRLGRRFDLVYEISEWQNEWYTNGVYPDGLTNEQRIIGHWGADQRAARNPVGALSHYLQIGWIAPFGGRAEVELRSLENQSYLDVQYETAYQATLRYSRPFRGFTAGVEALGGRDVFGESFSRFGAFARYTGDFGAERSAARLDSAYDTSGDSSAEVFVEAGAATSRIRIDLDAGDIQKESSTGAHVALGARRAVSDRSDLGARIELDDIDGNMLVSVRAIDYRYRFANPLAMSIFIGASRYDLATPAYGLYYGAGIQWRDLFRGWDVGVDMRSAKKVARDKLLPEDPPSVRRPDAFYTIQSLSLSVSKRF